MSHAAVRGADSALIACECAVSLKQTAITVVQAKALAYFNKDE